MSDSGLPLVRLHVLCGVCALLAAVYGYLAIEPNSTGVLGLPFGHFWVACLRAEQDRPPTDAYTKEAMWRAYSGFFL